MRYNIANETTINKGPNKVDVRNYRQLCGLQQGENPYTAQSTLKGLDT